jgi:hypothetical protein
MSSQRDKARYQEFLRFQDAWGGTFKGWLKVRKSQWYYDMQHGLLKYFWED